MPEPTRVMRHGLQVNLTLATFIDEELAPAAELASEQFWAGLAQLLTDFGPANANLLAERRRMQADFDDWIAQQSVETILNVVAQAAYLTSIGYLEPEPTLPP
ncbi:MAG: hypothetical protein ACKN9D_18645, partial [Actinomycetales bacterium]